MEIPERLGQVGNVLSLSTKALLNSLTVLVQRVRRRFGVLLHVRTVDKALRKKGRQTP
jgi:hypothetical protein